MMLLKKQNSTGWMRSLLLFTTLALFLPSLLGAGPAFPREWFWGEDAQRESQDVLIGKPLPEFAITDWVNGELTQEDLKGKIVVIDIWATWCGPCIGALPHNVEMYNEYKDQGVVIIGVCGSSGQEKMGKVLTDAKVNYPSGKDSSGKMAEAFKVQWWPTYAIIDRQGMVRGVGLSAAFVEEAIKKLLEEGDGPLSTGKSQAVPVKKTIKKEWLEMYDDDDRQELLGEITGKPAPSLAKGTNWQNGDPLDLSALKGKVVVLDFWATWCGLCINSIPHNNEVAEKYKDKVVFIGVCHPKGSEKVEETIKEHQIAYPVVVDSEGSIIESYRVNGYPDYYLIDKEGNLHVADLQNKRLEDALEVMLAE
jgi:thiol-disulfide isomerase/thioredoxin